MIKKEEYSLRKLRRLYNEQEWCCTFASINLWFRKKSDVSLLKQEKLIIVVHNGSTQWIGEVSHVGREVTAMMPQNNHRPAMRWCLLFGNTTDPVCSVCCVQVLECQLDSGTQGDNRFSMSQLEEKPS